MSDIHVGVTGLRVSQQAFAQLPLQQRSNQPQWVKTPMWVCRAIKNILNLSSISRECALFVNRVKVMNIIPPFASWNRFYLCMRQQTLGCKALKITNLLIYNTQVASSSISGPWNMWHCYLTTRIVHWLWCCVCALMRWCDIEGTTIQPENNLFFFKTKMKDHMIVKAVLSEFL